MSGVTGDPLDRIEADMTWAKEKAIRRPPLSMEQADALVAVARAAREIEWVFDGFCPCCCQSQETGHDPECEFRAALARLDGPR